MCFWRHGSGFETSGVASIMAVGASLLWVTEVVEIRGKTVIAVVISL
jgi:hypothetical protein